MSFIGGIFIGFNLWTIQGYFFKSLIPLIFGKSSKKNYRVRFFLKMIFWTNPILIGNCIVD